MGYQSKVSAFIKAPTTAVWEALTKPELIKKYFFGVDVLTDWKQGSPITYKGEWQGREVVDKGHVLEIEPNRLLVTDYFPGSSGLEDKPENYQGVTYQLEGEDGGTRLTVIQDRIPDEKACDD